MADLPPRVTQEQWDALDAAGEQVIAARMSRIQRMKRRNIEGNTMSDKHTAAQGELPELPYSELFVSVNQACVDGPLHGQVLPHKRKVWTATQMHEYARASLALRATEGQAQTSAAADYIDAKAERYLEENADTEHDTGATVFRYGEAGRDYHSSLVELAEEIRAIQSAGDAACTLPPSGWHCTRTPGHEGPCAAWPLDEPATQLADSTAPGAPVVGIGTEFLKLRMLNAADCLPGCPVYLAVDVHALSARLATPTAQQSLTAGGAVPMDIKYMRALAASLRNEDEMSSSHYWAVGHDAADLIDRLLAAAPLPQVQSEALKAENSGCHWAYQDGSEAWASACGELWSFIDGGPEENGVKFCQGCGKPVAIAAQQAIKPSVDNDGGVA